MRLDKVLCCMFLFSFGLCKLLILTHAFKSGSELFILIAPVVLLTMDSHLSFCRKACRQGPRSKFLSGGTKLDEAGFLKAGDA